MDKQLRAQLYAILVSAVHRHLLNQEPIAKKVLHMGTMYLMHENGVAMESAHIRRWSLRPEPIGTEGDDMTFPRVYLDLVCEETE